MSQTKRASRGKGPSKAVSVLGIAGVSLAASATGSSAEMPAMNAIPSHPLILGDEEISDVSLATFHAFDQDSQKTSLPGIQLARGGCGCGNGCGGCGHGCGGCGHGCGHGCGGCGHGCGGCGHGCGRGCGWGWRGCGWGGCGGCGWGWGWGGCCLSWGGCSPLC